MVRTEVTKISMNCSFSAGLKIAPSYCIITLYGKTAAFSRVKIKEKLVTEIETC
jgi:hypothetical protein